MNPPPLPGRLIQFPPLPLPVKPSIRLTVAVGCGATLGMAIGTFLLASVFFYLLAYVASPVPFR